MFLLNSWQNLRGFRNLFFENPSRGLKVMNFLSWGLNFWPQNVIFGPFDNVTLIFEDGVGQKFGFWTKKWQTLMGYNFWTSGQIFILQKSKLVRILSPIHWNLLDLSGSWSAKMLLPGYGSWSAPQKVWIWNTGYKTKGASFKCQLHR